MDQNGWTNVAFAKEVGISLSYLSDILSGRSRLERRADLIKKMAATLGVPTTMIRHHAEVDA